MNPDSVLVLNGGSSSLKFGLYTAEARPTLRLRGKIDRIGSPDTSLAVTEADGQAHTEPVAGADHAEAARSLLDCLSSRGDGALDHVRAVGHRVVHGMAHTAPERVTPALLDELRGLVPLAPDHLPTEIGLIEACQSRLAVPPHIACFDTAFHADLPDVARQLAIPRRLQTAGIRRYGFHGLSYAYLTEELARCEPRPAARRRVVLAHLGSGASMAAVAGGRSIDTSMGFTPTAGLPMSTRSGDLDPGVGAYLARTANMSAEAFYRMASDDSGLLGVSETSGDMRDLLAREATDARAADAIGLFCYQAKKCIGAYAAALGGIDTLVFAGGIGESAAAVRSRICEGLGFLGIELDAERNASHRDVISTDSAATTVRVIRTDEELMIARSVMRLLGAAEG